MTEEKFFGEFYTDTLSDCPCYIYSSFSEVDSSSEYSSDSDNTNIRSTKRQKTLVIDSDMASETKIHGTSTWYYRCVRCNWGFSNGSAGKESTCKVGDTGDTQVWFLGLPWGRAWQPTSAFLPGKSHGLRSLVGYSPWGRRVGHDWATKHTWNELASKVLVK